jgi:hypothetical protein
VGGRIGKKRGREGGESRITPLCNEHSSIKSIKEVQSLLLRTSLFNWSFIVDFMMAMYILCSTIRVSKKKKKREREGRKQNTK